MKLAALVLALAALAFVVPANAQVTGAHELKTTVPAKGVAGKPGQIDYYYFAGEAGSRQTFTWTGKGQAMLILFTPDGDAMVEAEGSGTVKLEAVLSWTDVYSVAVVRKNPALAYTLARQATVPTFGEAELATWAGYVNRRNNVNAWGCWVIPGVQRKSIFPDGEVWTRTLSADRKSFSLQKRDAKGVVSIAQYEKRIEGNELVTEVTYPDGKHKTSRVPYNESMFVRDPSQSTWRGYWCDDARKP